MSDTTKLTVMINSDGSCIGNPGPGGYAALVEIPGYPVMTTSGGEAQTTNQRMELTAAIAGMEALNLMDPGHNMAATLRTDSQYVTKGMTEWLPNWTRNGWTNAQGNAVKNRDLWERLAALTAEREMNYEWVKGHSGDRMNELCDQRALACAERARSSGSFCNHPDPEHLGAASWMAEARWRVDNPGGAAAGTVPETAPNPYAGRSQEWLQGAADGLRTALRLAGGDHDQIAAELERTLAAQRNALGQ